MAGESAGGACSLIESAVPFLGTEVIFWGGMAVTVAVSAAGVDVDTTEGGTAVEAPPSDLATEVTFFGGVPLDPSIAAPATTPAAVALPMAIAEPPLLAPPAIAPRGTKGLGTASGTCTGTGGSFANGSNGSGFLICGAGGSVDGTGSGGTCSLGTGNCGSGSGMITGSTPV